MKPYLRLVANQRDISAIIRNNLSSLELQDSVGLEADSLTLVVNDHHQFYWPSRGATLDIWLGYEDAHYYKGRFVVEELDASGPPHQLTVHARAIDAQGLSRSRKTRNWSGQTVGGLVERLAQEQQLIPAVSDSLRNYPLNDRIQQNETDSHFLSRLGRDIGALAKVKAGRLLLVEQGAARTANGRDMPLVELNRNQCSDYQYQERSQDEFDRVGAYYYQYTTYTRPRYHWPSHSFYTSTYRRYRRYTVFFGNASGNTHYLRQTFSNRADAERAARAAFRDLASNASTMALTLQQGQPQLQAEMRLALSGFRGRINRQDWIISEVRHTLDGSSGLQSTLQAVRPALFEEQQQ